MARKRRFRFGLRDVLAGRLRIAQGRRGNGEFCFAARRRDRCDSEQK
jgi:hypothetical protein